MPTSFRPCCHWDGTCKLPGLSIDAVLQTAASVHSALRTCDGALHDDLKLRPTAVACPSTPCRSHLGATATDPMSGLLLVATSDWPGALASSRRNDGLWSTSEAKLLLLSTMASTRNANFASAIAPRTKRYPSATCCRVPTGYSHLTAHVAAPQALCSTAKEVRHGVQATDHRTLSVNHRLL